MFWKVESFILGVKLVTTQNWHDYSQMTPAPSVESQLSMSGDRAQEEIPFACYVLFKDAARAKVTNCGITHKPKH